MSAQGREKTLGPRLRGDDEPADRSRRAQLIAALALSGGLVSCGFRLRGTQQLPFDSIFIAAPSSSTISDELSRSIRTGSSTRVVDDRAAAQAVLEIVSEARERDVLSVNAQGRAREHRLRLRVVFRVQGSQGREYLGQTQVSTTRDLASTEEQTLAREYEETQLYQDMLVDVAAQMLRRLAALKV